MKLEQIYKNNKHLGIETKFFEDEKDMHGYIEYDILYLNVNDPEILTTNKYGILHFYKDTRIFKSIKSKIFKALTKEQYNEIYNNFLFHCAGAFEEDERKMIEDEIVYSLLVLDKVISPEVSKIVDGAYEDIVSKKLSLAPKSTKIKNCILNFETDKEIDQIIEEMKKNLTTKSAKNEDFNEDDIYYQ